MFIRKKLATTARLNVINKEIDLFEKEFHNSLNLTNFPQRDLQLNGVGIVRGKLVQGAINWEVIFWAVIVRRAVRIGGNCPGSDCLGAIGIESNCLEGNCPGGNCPRAY